MKVSPGVGVQCTACGGTFPLQTLAATAVWCPYCGVRQELAQPAHDEARRYREDVFGAMRAADADRKQAERLAQWSDKSSPAQFLMLVLILVPITLAWVAGPAGISAETVMAVAIAAGAALLVVAVVAFVQHQRARGGPPSALQAQPSAATRAKKVACPHCGAPNQLLVGQAVHTCAFCRGALMPSRTAMVQALDALRLERRTAALVRHRAERLRTAKDRRAESPKLLLWIPVGLAPLLLLPIAVIAKLDGASRIFGGAVIVVCIAACALGWARLRARRRLQVFHEALSDLAAQFHGCASTQLDDLVRWLDDHWAGTYELRRLWAGPRFGTVTVDAWGFAALVVMNPAKGGPLSDHHPRYADILLAAWVPGVSEGHPAPPLDPRATGTLEWLRRSGFDVRRTEAGLIASAHPAVIDHLEREPGRVHHLATIIGHLVRLAHEIGAQPVSLTS